MFGVFLWMRTGDLQARHRHDERRYLRGVKYRARQTPPELLQVWRRGVEEAKRQSFYPSESLPIASWSAVPVASIARGSARLRHIYLYRAASRRQYQDAISVATCRLKLIRLNHRRIFVTPFCIIYLPYGELDIKAKICYCRKTLRHPTRNIEILNTRFEVIEFCLKPDNQSTVETLTSCLKHLYRLTNITLDRYLAQQAKISDWRRLYKVSYISPFLRE